MQEFQNLTKFETSEGLFRFSPWTFFFFRNSELFLVLEKGYKRSLFFRHKGHKVDNLDVDLQIMAPTKMGLQRRRKVLGFRITRIVLHTAPLRAPPRGLHFEAGGAEI